MPRPGSAPSRPSPSPHARAGTLHIDLIADRVRRRPAGRRWSSIRPPSLDPGSASRVEPGEHELGSTRSAATAAPARACTASSTRPTSRIYTYTQFEPADARRMFACFEQPDLKAELRDHACTPPRTGRWSRNGAELVRRRRVGDGTATWEFAETEPDLDLPDGPGRRRLRRASTRAIARGRGEVPMAILLPAVAGRAPRRRPDLPASPQDGFGVFERHFALSVPVRQVRPGLRARVQRRRHGERRLRDRARRVRLPQPGDPGLLPGPRRHDPARAVAHVVRRPGDDARGGTTCG